MQQCVCGQEVSAQHRRVNKMNSIPGKPVKTWITRANFSFWPGFDSPSNEPDCFVGGLATNPVHNLHADVFVKAEPSITGILNAVLNTQKAIHSRVYILCLRHISTYQVVHRSVLTIKNLLDFYRPTFLISFSTKELNRFVEKIRENPLQRFIYRDDNTDANHRGL